MEYTFCKYEIIVVDNASTECDPERFKALFPFIKLVKNPRNYGFAKGNNTGIRAAAGALILLLNSDTVLLNNAIDLACKKILSDQKIGALSVKLVSTDGSLQQCTHHWSDLGKLVGCTFRLHHIFSYFKNIQPDLEKEAYSQYLWGTFFLFPRSILEIFENRRLPETFFMYGEDTEWSYYIRAAGYRLYYLPEAKILHYGAASPGPNKADKWANGFHNEYRLHLIIKGRLYTFFYYAFLSLFYFSGFRKENFQRGRYIFKYICKHAFKSRKYFLLKA